MGDRAGEPADRFQLLRLPQALLEAEPRPEVADRDEHERAVERFQRTRPDLIGMSSSDTVRRCHSRVVATPAASANQVPNGSRSTPSITSWIVRGSCPLVISHNSRAASFTSRTSPSLAVTIHIGTGLRSKSSAAMAGARCAGASSRVTAAEDATPRPAPDIAAVSAMDPKWCGRAPSATRRSARRPRSRVVPLLGRRPRPSTPDGRDGPRRRHGQAQDSGRRDRRPPRRPRPRTARRRGLFAGPLPDGRRRPARRASRRRCPRSTRPGVRRGRRTGATAPARRTRRTRMRGGCR